MEKMLMIIAAVLAADVLHHFQYNYGQVFKDYYGSSRCAINGLNSDIDQSDVYWTPRGAYFDCCKNMISLPQNTCSINDFGTPPFSIAMWITIASSNCIILSFTGVFSFDIVYKNNINAVRLKYSSTLDGLTNGLLDCNLYAAQWVLFLLTYDVNIAVSINGVTQLIYNTGANTLVYTAKIGGLDTIDSFQGTVWYIYYSFSLLTSSAFMSTATNQCLISGCSSCTNSIINLISNEIGCIDDNKINFNNYKCQNSCLLGGGLGCNDNTCLKCLCKSCLLNSLNQCICAETVLTDPLYSCDCTIYKYSASGVCTNCLSPCKYCANGSSCLVCKDPNAVLGSTGTCICKSGYWGVLPLSTSTSCQVCNIECNTCNSNNLCDSCLVPNSEPHAVIGCKCSNGYYNTTRLISSGFCIACIGNCLTCNSADTCLTCIALNSVPSLNGFGCECNSRYYNTTSLNTPGACVLNIACSIANSQNSCIMCIASNSFVNSSAECECNEGYYGNYPLVSLDNCIKCTENCTKCSDNLFYHCIRCRTNYFFGMCMEKCPFGYYNSENICHGTTYTMPIIKFSFTEVAVIEFKDSMNNLIAKVTRKEAIINQDVYFTTIPYRGIFLKGLGLEVTQVNNQPLFSTETVMTMWLNPSQPEAVVIYKGDSKDFVYKVKMNTLDIRVFIKVDQAIKECVGNSVVGVQNWFYLMVALKFSSKLSLAIIKDGETLNLCTYDAPFADKFNLGMHIASDSEILHTFQGYIYQYVQYIYQPSNADVISKDCNGCNFCPITQTCIQNCPYNQFYSESLNQCINCTDDCTNGCIMAASCNICIDNGCIKCSSFEANSCLECIEGYEVVNGLCQKCQTGNFYNNNTLKCESCKGLCLSCESLYKCLSCKENSVKNDNFMCVCGMGFKGDETCEQEYFKLVVTVGSDNSLILTFSEELSVELQVSDLIVTLSNTTQVISIEKYSDFDYTLRIEYTEDISDANTNINLEVLVNLTSKTNKLLLASVYTAKLFPTSSYSSAETLQKQKESAAALGTQSATAGASLSLGSSLLNFDPTSIFNFMSTAEMFYSVYLFNIKIDPILSNFLLATRLQSKVPNVFYYLINSDEAVHLDNHFIDYGFKTNMFLLNTGTHFTMLVVFILLGLILLMLNQNQWLKGKLSAVTSMFKYSVFLRLWLQVYLELSIAAVVCLRYASFSNYSSIIDSGVSILIILSNALSIPRLMFLIKERVKLVEGSETELFIKKFSTFFEEFKDQGLSASLFHLIFVLKRFTLIICFCFIRDSVLQLMLLLTSNLSVISKQLSLYSIIVRPFKISIYNYYHFCNEMLISMFYFILLLTELPEYTMGWAFTTDFCIKTVFTAWGLNILISLYLNVLKISNIIRGFLKPKSLGPKDSPQKVYPITEAHESP